MTPRCLLALLLIGSTETPPQEEVAALHKRYMQASISHDIETLRSLTAEDATWQLGPRLLEGRDEVLSPNEFDAGIQTSLEYNDVRVEGNVVEFVLFERGEVLRAIGMEVLRHYPRFVFQDGRVKRKEPWKPSPDLAQVDQLMQPLRQWIREEHPEAISVIRDEAGVFVFSREVGELMLELTREWVEAGRPGRR